MAKKITASDLRIWAKDTLSRAKERGRRQQIKHGELGEYAAKGITLEYALENFIRQPTVQIELSKTRRSMKKLEEAL